MVPPISDDVIVLVGDASADADRSTPNDAGDVCSLQPPLRRRTDSRFSSGAMVGDFKRGSPRTIVSWACTVHSAVISAGGDNAVSILYIVDGFAFVIVCVCVYLVFSLFGC